MRYTLILILLLTVNCFANQIGIPNGGIYTSGEDAFSMNSFANDERSGEACAKSTIGWFASGDASVEAAANKAGIKKISSVQHRAEGILGFYQEFCTIVRGK